MRDLGFDLGRIDRDRFDLVEIRVGGAENERTAAADPGRRGETVEEDLLLFRRMIGWNRLIPGGEGV
jgi:hypothetical protein